MKVSTSSWLTGLHAWDAARGMVLLQPMLTYDSLYLGGEPVGRSQVEQLCNNHRQNDSFRHALAMTSGVPFR